MLKVPPPARIAIGSATVGGQSVELFLNPEWARYFESLNSQVVTTSSAVGLPGAPGQTGAAGSGVCLSDDAGSSVEFIPLRGSDGAQGIQGPALFVLAESETQDALPMVPSNPEEAFVAPSALLNSWVNYDVTLYNPAGFFKDSRGIVHLRGLVKSGTAMDTTIFTLPAGYRPSYREFYAVSSNSAFGVCYVDPDGTVRAFVGSTIYFSLDGITFRAAGTF